MTSTERKWLRYGDVKRRIEACTGSDGKYILNQWIQGTEPLLPRHHFPGTKWAVYPAQRVEELLNPYRTTKPQQP